MNSVALPLPKTAGGRPPFGRPPVKTTFGSGPDDHNDPIERRISSSVEELLKMCFSSGAESANTLLRLIHQRKKFLERELAMIRMMSPVPMPPALANFYPIETIFDEDDLENTYVRLLQRLDEADNRLLQIVDERNG